MSDINPRVIKKALKNADKKWSRKPTNKIEKIQYTADFLACLEKLGVEIYTMEIRDQTMSAIKSHLGACYELEWVEVEREDADYVITASSDLLSFVVMRPKGHEHYLAIYIENKTMSPRFQMVSPTEIQAKLSCEELVAITDDLDADEVDELLTEFVKQHATF